MKLSTKIPILVAIPLIICFLVLGIVSFQSSKSDALFYTDKGKENGLDATMLYVDAFFSGKMNFIDKFAVILSENVDFNNKNLTDETVKNYLNNYLNVSGFSALFVGSANTGAFYYKSVGEEPYIVPHQDARGRGWYKDALRENKTYLGGDVYNDERLHEKVVTISAPIVKDGKVVGVIGGDMAFKSLKDNILSLHFSDTNTIFAYNSDLKFVLHPNEKLELQAHDVLKTIDSELKKTEKDGKYQPIIYTFEGAEKTAVCTNFSKTNWKFCSTNLTSDLNATLNDILMQNILLFLISLIVILAFLCFLIKQSLNPLNAIMQGSKIFFDFLNHKIKNASLIDVNTKDEFGFMANAINENIKLVENNLKQDTIAVEQSVQTAKAIESGDLSARITQMPANPQLIELKNVLNKMLDTLQDKVGKNTNEIEKIFDEYAQNDFRRELINAKGRVEIATNMLGEQVRKMLQAQLDSAKVLQEKSQTLKSSVAKINEGARAQANSLQESAAAVEQMSASMQAVSQKSNE
ncbi:methyl-accepting chemotaxis protein, partial [Campylobacter canadensis]